MTRGRAVQVTFDGQSFIQGGAANDLFQTLTTLANAVQTGNMAGIDAAMAELDRRSIASPTRRAASASSSRRSRTIARAPPSCAAPPTSAAASLEDANLAESISATQQADQAHQAALTALATAGRLSLMDYLK